MARQNNSKGRVEISKDLIIAALAYRCSWRTDTNPLTRHARITTNSHVHITQGVSRPQK